VQERTILAVTRRASLRSTRGPLCGRNAFIVSDSLDVMWRPGMRSDRRRHRGHRWRRANGAARFRCSSRAARRGTAPGFAFLVVSVGAGRNACRFSGSRGCRLGALSEKQGAVAQVRRQSASHGRMVAPDPGVAERLKQQQLTASIAEKDVLKAAFPDDSFRRVPRRRANRWRCGAAGRRVRSGNSRSQPA